MYTLLNLDIDNLHNLQSLNISHNYITQFPEAMMPNLLTFDLSFNKITNVNFSGIHLYDDVNVRPRIETILLNANELTSINMHLPNLCELNAGN
jgi:Leucine-rich repeat (LRR) protein